MCSCQSSKKIACVAGLVGSESVPPRVKIIGVGVRTDAVTKHLCDKKRIGALEGKLLAGTELRRGGDCAGLRSYPTDVSRSLPAPAKHHRAERIRPTCMTVSPLPA